MKKTLSILTIAAIFGFGAAARAAEEYPKKAFEATYSMTTPQGPSTVRMASDGKGKWLNETTLPSTKSTMICDYIARSCVTLIDPQKMAMKSPFDPSKQGATDEEGMKKKNAKSLGTKVVDGHPCNGWQYTFQGGDSEVWIGNDIGQLVHSETRSTAGKTTMALKSFSAKAPADSAFSVPGGYKFFDVPGAR